MRLVRCVIPSCGLVFDIEKAEMCRGHEKYEHGPNPNWRYGPSVAIVSVLEYCFVCPQGHALHDLAGWRSLSRRAPTLTERDAGIEWVLVGYDVAVPS